MGWFTKKPKEEAMPATYQQPIPQGYIDLGSMGHGPRFTGGRGGPGAMEVKVAEISGFEDLRELTNHVYNGNMLILDFTTIANDELQLKRIINELKRLVKDIDGDLAGINKNLLIVTPRGVRVDRQKIRRIF